MATLPVCNLPVLGAITPILICLQAEVGPDNSDETETDRD